MESSDFHQLSAADGFVITMLSMMALSLSVIGLLLFCIRRNVARRNPHVDALLEEMAAEEKREKQAASGEAPEREPWERDGDWWKN